MIGLHTTAKVSAEANRKLPARNTNVQLLTLYITLSVTDGQTLWCQ